MLTTLVADSWHLADFLTGPGAAFLPPERSLCLLDFGAGAGLPGIPLRAFFERGEYLLLEARAKRAIFLGEAVDRLALPATAVVEGRVEATVPAILADRPDAFLLCLSRAFAPWPQFLDLCRELVRPPMVVLHDITQRRRVEASLRHSLDRLQCVLEQTVNALAVTSEQRDPFTAGHQQRVSRLAADIAREMGLSEEVIEGVRVAGLVHARDERSFKAPGGPRKSKDCRGDI